jgi:hypothetical protein
MDYTVQNPVSALVADALNSDMDISDDEGDTRKAHSEILLNEFEESDIDDAVDIMVQYNDFDGQNFNDPNALEYDEDEGSDPAQEENVDYVDEDDNEINMEAYNTIDLDSNGLQKTEQGGVLHLVHGWMQQAHPERVSYLCSIGDHAHYYRDCTFLEIFLLPAPALRPQDPITLLRNPSHERLV